MVYNGLLESLIYAGLKTKGSMRGGPLMLPSLSTQGRPALDA
jgi:hypothetical protein